MRVLVDVTIPPAPVASETEMQAYSLALFAHVMVVVYLLGADLGRLYLVRKGAQPGTPDPTRVFAARGVCWFGSVTSLSLILILPAGISVGAAMGTYRITDQNWFIGTWIVAGLWLMVSVIADRQASRGDGKVWTSTDIVLRALLAPGFIYDGALVFLGASQTVDSLWLGTKVALYGLLILVSIPVRLAGFAVRRQLTIGGGPELGAALDRLSWPIQIGWLVIFIAAWLGTAKPF